MSDLTTEPLAQAGRVSESRRELERQRPRPAKPRREAARPQPSEDESSSRETPDTPPHRFDGMA